ncbi:ABC transporter permease [Paenibacillus chungangensis]|uniref:ABC transporter permease n=1 Tax=Paenibacillus chungangensis TaxID=696535 RepID=A0ABW3HUG1_9BACL
MRHSAQIALREIRMGLRNPWSYSFMALFSLFMLSLLLINAQGYAEGYSGITGTMMNLILYLLPLMALMLGSFSITGEKEEGNGELLSTYPLRTSAFLAGKYAGLIIVMISIVSIGFGLAGSISFLTGQGFSLQAYTLLLALSVSLVLMYTAIALLIGTLASNRWQALTVSVGIWFFTVIAWPALLIAALGMMPYMWIKPAVSALTVLNPAELSRLFIVVKLGGGAVLGPDYYEWVKWVRKPSGTLAFFLAVSLWIGMLTGMSIGLWERRRKRV